MKAGDSVVFGDRRNHSAMDHMTVGKTYTVMEYDENDTGWPEGCSGSPMIMITNDQGSQGIMFASRFDEINNKGDSNV